jgi:hypothetical protein
MLQLNINAAARIALAAGVVGTMLTVAFAAQTPQRGGTTSVSGVRTVGTTLQVMHAIVKPASDAVFAAGGEPPKDAKAWTALENQAIALAESGNLLMLGDRAKDQGDWMKFSRALVDASAGAVKAAQAKNADAMSTASDAVYETCEACHMKYLKK